MRFNIAPIVIETEIPVFIITDKKSKFRTNCFFYQGKNIAVVKYGDTEYVLTTAGEYVFNYKGNVYNSERITTPLPCHVNLADLTDKKIKTLDDNNLIHNWGWFGVNVWKKGKLQDKTHISWTLYDEAMENFATYVKNDITADIIVGLALTDDDNARLTRSYFM